jgi:hypothetical protein
MAEARALAGAHPVERCSDRLGADVLAQVASLADLLHPVAGIHVLDVVEVDLPVAVVHAAASYPGPAAVS